MKQLFQTLGLASLVLLWFVTLAMASEEAGPMASTAAAGLSQTSTWFFIACVVAAAFGLGMAALGSALAQGNAVSKAVEGIARQPEASGSIQTAMIIGISFIESLTIYALVIALILLFANPFLNYFVK